MAPSGFGKTTMCYAVLRKALKSRSEAQWGRLPFDVPLPELAETELTVFEFVRARLAAHHPGVGDAYLRGLLREKGAVLLCDGFDRLSAERQRNMEVELKALTRDYPSLQLFVFSREASKPILDLPVLIIRPLSAKQQTAFVEVFMACDSLRAANLLNIMPELLRRLCTNPLLLQLILEFRQRENRFPSRIEALFQSWLERILMANARDQARGIDKETALTLIAKETLRTPISKAKALSLIREHQFPDGIFDELLRCDAVRVSGSAVDLQHETLADYLRARDIASLDETAVLRQLSTIPLQPNSMFPVLLMALLPSRGLQQKLWMRISKLSITAYLNVLRYRADLSGEMENMESDDLAYLYLRDLLEGIEFPLDGFFPQLQSAVTELLIGDENNTIAVTGTVSPKPAQVAYAFHPFSGSAKDKVVVGWPPTEFGIHYTNLEMSGYPLDSGRLLGMQRLRDELLQLVKERGLKGGTVWAAERLIGRVRYLAHELGFPISERDDLAKIEEVLRPHAGEIVRPPGFSSLPTFPVAARLDDLAVLRSAGTTALDPWWLRFELGEPDATTSEQIIRALLDEHYKRLQYVYAEIVKGSFQHVAGEFGFYSSLPVRWRLTVIKRDRGSRRIITVCHRWFPVPSWDEAGADVEFSDVPPEWFAQSDASEVRAALAKLGRLNSRTSIRTGWGPIPRFDGTSPYGPFYGETSVASSACDLIMEEVKGLFSELPS